MAQGVNGPLLEALARRIGYHDMESIALFKRGAKLVFALTLMLPWFAQRASGLCRLVICLRLEMECQPGIPRKYPWTS